MQNETLIKETFEIVHADFVRYFERFLDTGYKVLGLLLIAIGWMLTASKTSCNLISQNILLHLFALSLPIFGGAIYVITTYGLRNKSEKALHQLNELNYIDVEYYICHRIEVKLYIIVLVMNEFLFMLLFVLVLRCW